MATIKDIAKKAGVSISTVSYALNGSQKISPETKEKIWKIAKELGYYPNTHARSLKGKNKHLLALVVHEIKGPYYEELVRGIQDVAVLFGYNLVIFCELDQEEPASVSFLANRFVDGAILLSSRLKDEDIEFISKKKLPLVVLDRTLKLPNVASVVVNNKKGGREIAKHFVELGHKRIGFMHGALDSHDNSERYKGFISELEKYGLTVSKNDTLFGNFTEEGGYNAMKEYLKKNKKTATAFFCANDEMAIGTIKAIQDSGLNVPEDISIAGFDDIPLSVYVSPKLTTIKRPVYQLGSFSAHQLLSMISGKNMNNSTISLDVELIVRESTTKPKSK